MSSITTRITHVVVPFLVFPVLATLAFKMIVGHADQSGLSEKLNSHCTPLSSGNELPYLLSYTGISAVDVGLCNLVAFFHASFTPTVTPFLMYFLIQAAPISACTALESCRQKRSFVIAFPVIFGIMMQTLTFGVTFCVYWLLFIVSGAAQLSAEGITTRVTKAHVEAVIFGLFIGMLVPTACMLGLEDPHVTAIWQIFPVIASMAQASHLMFRSPANYPDSGYGIIRVLYIGLFVLGSSTHLAVVLPKSAAELQTFFLPSISVLPKSTSLELQALDLLQWDMTFGLASSLLGTLWFAKTFKQFFCLLGWNLFALPLFGPGAAFSASALWREASLHTEPAQGVIKSVKYQ